MPTSHLIGYVLISFFLAAPGWTHAEDAVFSIPGEERKVIESLVEELVSLGLPDTAGGEYFVGPAFVRQQFDPDKEEPVVPTRYSRIQETVPESTEMIYKYAVPGPHFRLANGRWLLGLQYLLSPSERHEVFTHKLEERELASLMQDATTAHPVEPDADFDDWFEKLNTDDLDAMKLGVKQGVPLWQYLQLPREDTSLGVCLLLRAGARDAAILCYTIADTRCREYWRMFPWSDSAGPFDPTGQYEGIDQLEKKWHAENQTYEVERPSVAFRRDLNRYFFHMLTQDDRPYTLEVTAALARATLDGKDPQRRNKKIDALLTCAALPHKAAADADLAAVLQCWGETEQRMIVRNTTGDGSPSIRTEFADVSSEFSPTQEHLPELIALLDDSRPTRWIDYQGSRSVGENAIRAIAIILEKNPFELIDHDAAAPWTEEARRESNRALRKWWVENRSKYEISPE